MYKLFLFLIPLSANAFLNDFLKIKEGMSNALLVIKDSRELIDETADILNLEKDLNIIESEVNRLSNSLKSVEEMGIFVEDLKDLSSLKDSSISQKIKFLKSYKRRAESFTLLLSKFLSDNNTIIANQSIETNRALRELIKDLQVKDLRAVRAQIKQKNDELKKRILKDKFIKSQYSQIRNHQKNTSFHSFYPFKKMEIKRKKDKKSFLGLF